MANERYFNFPICLLTGFLLNSDKVLTDIADYCIYDFMERYRDDEHFEYCDHDQLMERATGFFKITLADPDESYLNGEAIYNSVPEGSPKAGLSLRIYWDFYKTKKKEFDKILFLGYLALKSIVQKKSYCKITNSFWLARMDGKAKSVDSIDELSDQLKKYSSEYYTRKIRSVLSLEWHVKCYSRYSRGFYVSFTMNFEDLVFLVEKRRKSSLLRAQDQEKKEAIRKVLNRFPPKYRERH